VYAAQFITHRGLFALKYASVAALSDILSVSEPSARNVH
jgi:hypothetical protein